MREALQALLPGGEVTKEGPNVNDYQHLTYTMFFFCLLAMLLIIVSQLSGIEEALIRLEDSTP